jgi:hypothetical protein
VAKIVRKFGVPASSVASLRRNSKPFSCKQPPSALVPLPGGWGSHPGLAMSLQTESLVNDRCAGGPDVVVNGFASALRAASICCGVIVGKNARGMHRHRVPICSAASAMAVPAAEREISIRRYASAHDVNASSRAGLNCRRVESTAPRSRAQVRRLPTHRSTDLLIQCGKQRVAPALSGIFPRRSG